MQHSYACEPLEPRSYCAKVTTPLDPAYHFDADAVRRVAGDGVYVYSATPGPADRTYLLAQTGGTLAIAAVLPDGTLDAAFGTHGVLLTNYATQSHYAGEAPGVLRTDAIGRVYFADNQRVLRLHADGTTDRSFGDGGVVRFTSDRAPVSLADLAAVDGGVLVATRAVVKGVQTFSVQRVGHGVKTVWSAASDSGERNYTDRGVVVDGADAQIGNRTLSNYAAKFAQSRSGLVLASVALQPTGKTNGFGDALTRDSIQVTRFDPAGHAQDLTRTTLRDTGLSSRSIALYGVRLSPSGRVLTTLGGSDVLQISLNSRKVQRYDPPVDLQYPQLRLRSDGFIYSVDDEFSGGSVLRFRRYAPDGTPDTGFGQGGVVTVGSADFSDLFTDTQGRLYVFARSNGDPPTQSIVRFR